MKLYIIIIAAWCFLMSFQTTLAAKLNSCTNRCGEEYGSSLLCRCDMTCSDSDSCCDDFQEACIGSCENRCFETGVSSNSSCACNKECKKSKSCCEDYEQFCEIEKYFCKGKCNVTLERCSCKSDCVANKSCCSDYLESCEGQRSWSNEKCASNDDMNCPNDYDVTVSWRKPYQNIHCFYQPGQNYSLNVTMECNVTFDESPLILFSIDGFKSEYIYRNLTPNIWKLASCGVHVPYMRVVYPTKTFPSHYSIVTGLYPESSGIIDNKMYDFRLKEEFRLGRPSSFKPAWWKGEAIWTTAKTQGKITASFFWPGSDIKSDRNPNYFYKYDGSIDNEERMYQALDWLDLPHDQRPSFMTLYLSLVDSAGHNGGPDSGLVNTALAGADKYVGVLMNGLKLRNLGNCVNIILLADHGMAPTSCDRKTSLEDYGVDMDAVYVRTGATGRIGKSINSDRWKDFNAEAIHKKLRCKHNQTHWMSYLKYRYFPKRFHYANNDRIEPIQLVMDEGWLVEGRKDSDKCYSGSHGFDNEFKSMHALFAAHGPGFKRNFNSSEAIESIELYNLMADLLNITPAPNNGTTGSMYHVMSDPPKSSTINQVASKHIPFCESAAMMCKKCFRISKKDFYNQINLSPLQKTSSLQQNAPFGLPLVDSTRSLCTFVQKDYVSVINSMIDTPLFVTFTLQSNKNYNLWTPSDCIEFFPRILDAVSCNNYFKAASKNIILAFLYPAELSNGDAVYAATILNNQVPMYEPARKIWNYTARSMADWARRYNGIHVIAGPVYDYNFDGLFDSNEILARYGKFLTDQAVIPIPTHFFMIAVRCSVIGRNLNHCMDSPDNLDVLSFIIPNFEIEPCHAESEYYFEWIPGVLKQHVSRIRDIELLTKITFFPTFDKSGGNSVVRFKIRLPQFSGQWLKDFLNVVPPVSKITPQNSANAPQNLSIGIFLCIFWTVVVQYNM